MARTKRIEKAEPKMGEIVSFAAHKAARHARRADVFCTVGVIAGEVSAGDIVLCGLKLGGHTLRRVNGRGAGEAWQLNGSTADIKGIVGRVVTTEPDEESEGA